MRDSLFQKAKKYNFVDILKYFIYFNMTIMRTKNQFAPFLKS